jgi:hypothetical protein
MNSVDYRGGAEWEAFCKIGDLSEIASARFGRLAILAHEEGLLAPILADDRAEVQRRTSELSAVLSLTVRWADPTALSKGPTISMSESAELSEKLTALLCTVPRSTPNSSD